MICGIWCVYLKSNVKISCLVVALITVVAVVVAMFNVIAYMYVAVDKEHIQYMGFFFYLRGLFFSFFFAFIFV